MPVEVAIDHVTLHGNCSIEDAEGLFLWLQKHPTGQARLAGVEHLHAAVLQTLMANSTDIAVSPDDAFSAECVRQAGLSPIV